MDELSDVVRQLYPGVVRGEVPPQTRSSRGTCSSAPPTPTTSTTRRPR